MSDQTILEEKNKLFNFLTKQPMFSEYIVEEDLHALSGINELRRVLVDQGCRSFVVAFLDRDNNPGFIWRNTPSDKKRILAESMLEFAVDWDASLREDINTIADAVVGADNVH